MSDEYHDSWRFLVIISDCSLIFFGALNERIHDGMWWDGSTKGVGGSS